MPFPPADDKNKAPPGFQEAVKGVVADAASKGNLKPIQDFLKKEGINHPMDVVMTEVAKIPALEGKDPAGIVAALEEDMDLLDELTNRLEMGSVGGDSEEEEDAGEFAGMGIHEAMAKRASKAPAESDSSLED